MANLVRNLKAEGVPIDGIGIEGHLIVGEVPTTMVENFRQFTDLGVEISINELDIRMTLPATDALLEQQKKDYETVVSACMAVEKCVVVTVWDWTDKVRCTTTKSSSISDLCTYFQYSWIPGTFPGQGAACPWDEVRIHRCAWQFSLP